MTCRKGTRMHRWTDEEKAYLAEIVEGRPYEETAAMMAERFGDHMGIGNVKGAIKRYGHTNGLSGRYGSGHEPANKGRRWDEYMSEEAQERCRANAFKNGNVPPNGARIPVGTERITKDGYTEVKFREVGGDAHRPSGGGCCWKQKHVYVWEQLHGPVPSGNIVMFADGDKGNFEPGNLVCVSRSDAAVINHNGIKYHDAKSLETAVLVAKVTRAATRRTLDDRVCTSCGETYSPRFANQKRCDRCIGRKRV